MKRLAVLALALAVWAATPAPVSTASVSGTASWYCSSSSSCTRGYGPDDLVAAIDRKDTPWDKGDRVTVTSGGRSVTVRIVDVCGCPGARIIDLTSGAFKRLAPLSVGVIPVTISDGHRTVTSTPKPTPGPTVKPIPKPTPRPTPPPTVKPRPTLPPTDTTS